MTNRRRAAVHPKEAVETVDSVNHPLEQPDGDNIWQLCLSRTYEREYEICDFLFRSYRATKRKDKSICQRTTAPALQAYRQSLQRELK